MDKVYQLNFNPESNEDKFIALRKGRFGYIPCGHHHNTWGQAKMCGAKIDPNEHRVMTLKEYREIYGEPL